MSTFRCGNKMRIFRAKFINSQIGFHHACFCQSSSFSMGDKVALFMRNGGGFVIKEAASKEMPAGRLSSVWYRSQHDHLKPIAVIVRQYHRSFSTSGDDDDKKAHPASNAEMKKMKIKKSNDGNPTVFYDSLRIFVKSGQGGQGLPQKGGLGGSGGDVIVVGHKEITLKKISQKFPTRRFIASPGADSKLFCLMGEPGKNVVVPVPLGVSVITEYGHKLGEINKHGDKLVIAKGGVGARASNGFSAQPGQAYNVALDLKLIADVGFVGFPNAGKSTLLKAISRANPKIASYPFTTIRPNIGVIEYPDFRKISLADLPGLIEGAHANIGLGYKFLKHVERTKLLLFVVDLHGFQLSPQHPIRSALETIVLLNKELELYKEELTEKPAILVLNKMDVPGSYKQIQQIRETLTGKEQYEEFLKTMPEEYLPENVILFDEIVPISAKADPISVGQLAKVIRKVIDYYEPVENNLKTRN